MLIITNEDGLGNDFYEFEAVVPCDPDLIPDADEIAALIGYALRETLAGEELEFNECELLDSDTALRLAFYYDSTKSRRDDPDFYLAFERAAEYLDRGTPIRLTNRSGPDTKGTRKFQGLGIPDLTITLL